MTTENGATSVGWDDDAPTWEEAVAAGWKRTADRWAPETLTLRPKHPIPPGYEEPCVCGTDFTCMARHPIPPTSTDTEEARRD